MLSLHVVLSKSFFPSRKIIPLNTATTANTRLLFRRWKSTRTTRSMVEEQQQPQILFEKINHPDYPDRQIAKIILNRPKANAMGSIMLKEFQQCLNELESSTNDNNNNSDNTTCRCAIIASSSDKVFSAGADLKERSTMTQQQAADFVTLLRNTFQRFASLPVPTIAAIEGVAVGGGLELGMAADIRVASSSCSLGLPETTLAIIPGAGGTQRLPRLIGVSKAKELIWTGRRVDGKEALDIGLIDRLSEPGQAMDDAIELAWQISASGPVGIRSSKSSIDKGIIANSMEEALEIERRCYAKVLPTEDRLEGLAAFKEGRTPMYKGK